MSNDPVPFSALRDASLQALKSLLAESPELIEDLRRSLETCAELGAKWGLKVIAGDPTAKDIMEDILQTIALISATIAARGQVRLAAWFEQTAPVVLSALLRGVALAFGIPLVI